MLRRNTQGRKKTTFQVLQGSTVTPSEHVLLPQIASIAWPGSLSSGSVWQLPAMRSTWLEVWTMPPPAGYLPDRGMGLAVEQSIFLQKTGIHWKEQFCFGQICSQTQDGYSAFSTVNTFRNYKLFVTVCIALSTCGKNQRGRFTWWSTLDCEKS